MGDNNNNVQYPAPADDQADAAVPQNAAPKPAPQPQAGEVNVGEQAPPAQEQLEVYSFICYAF